MAAEPTQLPQGFIDLFNPLQGDCIPAKPKREVRELVEAIEQNGRLLIEKQQAFTVHHHLCEVAEQWGFIEIPGIVESVREPLALDKHHDLPHLSRCLHQPLKAYKVELNRPYFVFESGQVETKAYQWNDELIFVHRLHSQQYPGEIHGTAVEIF